MQESSSHNFAAINTVNEICKLSLVQLSDRELILEYQKEYDLLFHNFNMFHVLHSAFGRP